MKSLLEYLSTKVTKPSMIYATDENIKQIVKDELDKLGHNANLNHIDVSEVTNMNSLFSCAYNDLGSKYVDLNPDISEWDVSNVTDMAYMFYACKDFNCNISKWDVSNVTRMDFMFHSCAKFNQDISNWKPKIFKNQGVFWDCPLKTEFRPKYFNSDKRIDEYLNIKDIDKEYIDGFANVFCIADPINDIFVDFLQKYEDSCVQLKDGFKVFILKKKEAAQYANEDDVAMFKVPEQCKNMEALIKYLVNIDNTDSLEEYTQKEIFTW